MSNSIRFWGDTQITMYIFVAALQPTATHCNTLRHSVLQICKTESTTHICRSTAKHCNTLQHIRSCRSARSNRQHTFVVALEPTATHCNTLRHVRSCRSARPSRQHIYEWGMVRTDAVCCSVLQCVAVCCSVLQCVAVRGSALQCVAVCCSMHCCSGSWCALLGHVVHSSESWHTHEFVMSHTGRIHVAHLSESWRTHGCAHMGSSCHIQG